MSITFRLWTSHTYKSNSYCVRSRPLYTSNPFVSNVKNVTVSDENEIRILWNKSKFTNNAGYELDKYQDGENSFMYSIPIDDNSDTLFVDKDVRTSSNSYVYQIKAKALTGRIFNEKGTVNLLR